MAKEKRILKIYRRMIRGCGRHSFYKSVPEIRLQGKWLEDYGFHVGEKLQADCKEGKIIISKIEE